MMKGKVRRNPSLDYISRTNRQDLPRIQVGPYGLRHVDAKPQLYRAVAQRSGSSAPIDGPGYGPGPAQPPADPVQRVHHGRDRTGRRQPPLPDLGLHPPGRHGRDPVGQGRRARGLLEEGGPEGPAPEALGRRRQLPTFYAGGPADVGLGPPEHRPGLRPALHPRQAVPGHGVPAGVATSTR
jgi:hypothetical protein